MKPRKEGAEYHRNFNKIRLNGWCGRYFAQRAFDVRRSDRQMFSATENWGFSVGHHHEHVAPIGVDAFGYRITEMVPNIDIIHRENTGILYFKDNRELI